MVYGIVAKVSITACKGGRDLLVVVVFVQDRCPRADHTKRGDRIVADEPASRVRGVSRDLGAAALVVAVLVVFASYLDITQLRGVRLPLVLAGGMR
jgi:hypothetical protein